MLSPIVRAGFPWQFGLIVALAAACGDDPGSRTLVTPIPDAGALGGFDAAVTVPVDAATPSKDAAPGTDASLPPPDASGPGADAGSVDAASADAGAVDGAAPDTGISDNPLAKYGLTPFPTTGMAISTPDRTWTWVDFPDTKCRDGSPAGIGIRRNSQSQDLMIFLEGGGACFDDITCLANPANADIWKTEPTGGILNASDANNPLKDWNLVYVPYCTGDVHAGTKPDARVSDLFPKEQFVGYLNMEKYLQRVVPTFPNPARVLLTGISAGGFGASSTAVLVQRAYPNEKMMMIDDSGPPQSGEVVPPCLQQRMREVWGLDKSILKDCGAACPNPNNYQADMGVYLVKTFNDRPSGLISSIHDEIIAGFFGAGNNNCTGIALLDAVPAETFERGLLSFRTAVKDYPTFGTFFPNSTQHTWLTDLFDVKFTAAEVNGVKLTKWVSDIVDGKGTSHVGP
jgi:hypothetical protein